MISVWCCRVHDYLEEIIGEDQVKNIVTTKLIKEFVRMNKETETTDDINYKGTASANGSQREGETQGIGSTQRRDEKRIDSLKSSVTDLNKRM